ncbi:MAG: DUF885 family protein [Pseudomonadota bacterium]
MTAFDLSRRAMLAGTTATVAVGALGGCARTPVALALTPTAAPQDAVEALLSRIAEQWLVLNPESASSLGIDKDDRAALKARLGDRSPVGLDAVRAMLRASLDDLAALDTSGWDEATRINVDVVRTAYESGLVGMAFAYGDVAVGGWRNSPYVVAQNVGAYLDTPRMLDSDHQIANSADAEAYLARMDAYADQLDGETARLRDAGGMGVIAPDFLLDKNLRQIRIARGGDVAQWDVVQSIARRTATMAGDFAGRAVAMATARIAPALDRQIAELERHRMRADDRAGVWKLPQGDGYYAWALAAATTTTMSPDAVHQMGLTQVAELQSQMDPILRGLGLTQGTVGARMTALGDDPRFQFPDNDEGRAAIIALLEQRIADIRRRMPQAFTVLVPGNVEVKRLPLAEEPGAPGAYGGAGTIDGSVPGRLWINLRNTAIWPRYSLPDLAYHEAIPGHAWQGEYSHRLPLIRTLLQFNAYSEGWALYAEQLADELGVYDADPVERLGYLQSLCFRACRLVVDTGLHAKRWTRAQAIQWFATTNGSSVDEVQGEVDRYCSWPGQACGYKVGHSEINRLRSHASDAMGPRFDVRLFNDAVITGGNVPLTALGRTIERHINERRG